MIAYLQGSSDPGLDKAAMDNRKATVSQRDHVHQTRNSRPEERLLCNLDLHVS